LPLTVITRILNQTSLTGQFQILEIYFAILTSHILKIKPENQRWQFALTTLIYLLDLMQSLLNLKIVQN
ncbi:hypothetical protein T01_9570, partial [Trichinella spiralis]